MYSFGRVSRKRLATCHSDLQLVMNKAIEIYDFTILCGNRDETAQNKAFDEGASKLQYPDSKHNSLPSTAVDIAPWPIDWLDIDEFFYLAGIVMTVASQLNIELQWGGRFKSLKDCPHFELVNPDKDPRAR
ncbi:hypothetical protein LCGC14_2780630 [marine sediment metagenome]|uniref:Peptidase M15C domain-containing protein n=1 Tax=marine sediment metagenome TaxID=412755 RepID=A0A0F9BJX3_9ZZZZ